MAGSSNTGHFVKIIAIALAVSLISKLFVLGTLGMVILATVALYIYATF